MPNQTKAIRKAMAIKAVSIVQVRPSRNFTYNCLNLALCRLVNVTTNETSAYVEINSTNWCCTLGFGVNSLEEQFLECRDGIEK